MSAEERLITLSVIGETLEKTLKRISEISGYTIDLQSGQQEARVSVKLSNVPIEKAFAKILGKATDYAIVWHDKEKKITIFIFNGSQKNKEDEKNKEVNIRPGQLSGQGIKFSQMSGTTDD